MISKHAVIYMNYLKANSFTVDDVILHGSMTAQGYSQSHECQ